MRKPDDLDIGFGLGSVFGAGIALFCVSTVTVIDYCKRLKSVKAAQKRLFEEIDQDIEWEENENF